MNITERITLDGDKEIKIITQDAEYIIRQQYNPYSKTGETWEIRADRWTLGYDTEAEAVASLTTYIITGK